MKDKYFKMALIEKEISITKLAELIGITRATLYNKINGKTPFSKSEVANISNILELTERRIKRIFGEM